MADTSTLTTRRLAALALAGMLGLGSLTGLAACSDEDGDGGKTDEEIQDVKDGADKAKDEVDQEVDAQNQGDNQG
ncbi:MAG: hypothetical protein ACJ739_07630 [Acidimicrobiales bacterium]